jgi:hypothetical protein
LSKIIRLGNKRKNVKCQGKAGGQSPPYSELSDKREKRVRHDAPYKNENERRKNIRES